MRHARWRLLRSEPDCVLIQDLGPWDRYATITNDAEHVVAEVIEDERMRVVHHGEPLQPPLGPYRRLFYVDSQGDTTELLVGVDGKFAGFRAIPRVGSGG